MQVQFDVSPRIIKILGQELIHDSKIAISELVKNAYDADATTVKITIGNDKIIIEDDGHGMNAETIKNYWLKPGASGKRDNDERTPKFKRLPLGEKGVGRLGVHQLGDQIQVISKTKNDKEVLFEINWSELEDKDNLKDLKPISIEENASPTKFKDSMGTKLIIRKLREDFNEKGISELQSDLRKLLSPFQGVDSQEFNIELHTASGLFTEENKISLTDILNRAVFEYDIQFEKDTITSFIYKCISPNVAKYPSKTIILEDKEVKETIEKLLEKDREEFEDDGDAGITLGTVKFRGYIFETKLSKLFNNPLSNDVREYLKENGGIRVYRDGIRIYNYGEDGKDNDILNLDRKRAKKLGDHIGYNQILATIELRHETSKILLKEKTNREGFIHNAAFKYLQRKLDFCMEVVMHYRKLDKAEMNLFEGDAYDRTDIDSKIKAIVAQVNQSSIEEREKKKINSRLYDFSKEFKEIKNIFLTASNTGLNLTFIVHEIDKILDHLEQTIQKGNLAVVERVFFHLKDTINTYKDTIRLNKKDSSHALSAIIKQSLFNTEYRFKIHKIEVEEDQSSEKLNLHGKKGLIIGTINNIFDNAIYWLETYNIRQKKIFIKTYSQDEHNVILIADNGKGFNISFEAALKPFITGRFDDSSMGIGLHLASQVMEAHQGSIEHGDWQIDSLPKEFSNGAIIKLSFPKEIK